VGAFERVAAPAAGRVATFQEVEIEVCEDVATNERLAHELHDRLELVFADRDKPAHAAALLGIEHELEPRHSASDGTSVGAAVAARIQLRFAAMRSAETGVRRDDDPEHLHAMRVAIRRLRSLVRAFGALWPKPVGRRLLRDLGETGRRLGAVRDLDVMLLALPADLEALPAGLKRAGERAGEWIRGQRDRTQAELRQWLCSPERLALAADIEHDLETIDGAGEFARTPMSIAARAPLERAVAKLKKLVAAIPPELPIEPAHRLRLTAKRLRYLADEVADVPGFGEYRKSLRAVVRVQQAFGELCDDEVAADRLLGWLAVATEAPPTAERAELAAALGGLATHRHLAAGPAREVAARSLAQLDKKKVWRRFTAFADDGIGDGVGSQGSTA
jgi:CHAD domain-containing protein